MVIARHRINHDPTPQSAARALAELRLSDLRGACWTGDAGVSRSANGRETGVLTVGWVGGCLEVTPVKGGTL